jgi:phosphatidate cytidylyltransferase
VTLLHDPAFQHLILGVLGLLVVATVVGRVLARMVKDRSGRETVANLNARVAAWWVMTTIFAIAVLTGGIGSILLFAILSFLALREFITLTPTTSGDHQALFWAFFVITPIQYLLVGLKSYGLFSIFIPVYAFLGLAIRAVLSGDPRRFLERAATIQWALMICVYCLSYAPALLDLQLPGFEHQGAKLLLFLAIVVQISDVAQYSFGKLFGRHRISPRVSPNKTWEGLIGGGLVATGLGAGIYWATPFSWWQAGGLALVIVLMGFGGGLVMSAVKRDRGVKDFGALIPGHGGILDRIDSLTFAAPVFFYVTLFLLPGGF